MVVSMAGPEGPTTVTLALHLGITYSDELVKLAGDHGEELFSRDIRDVFGDCEKLTFNVMRLSQECYRIKIKHRGVTDARYDKFNYDDDVCGLIGDELRLKFRRPIRIVDFDAAIQCLIVEVTRR